jgi:hypothetical protein
MQNRVPRALCYKVSKNGKTSYLFGTRHGFYKIPKQLDSLIKKGEIHYLLVEHITLPEKKERGVQGIPYTVGIPLDKLIERLAIQHDISIIGLDNRNDKSHQRLLFDHFFQISAFSYFFPDRAVSLSKKMIEEDKKIDNPYLKQDIQRLIKLGRNKRSQDPEMTRKRLDVRNQKWKPKIIEHLKKGNALIAVGNAHVLDMDGYIDILVSEGYHLEPYPIIIEPNVEMIDLALNPNTDQAIADFQEAEAKGLKNVLHSLIDAARNDFKILTISEKKFLDYILRSLLRDYVLENPALYAIQISMHSLIQFLKTNTVLTEKIKIDIQKVLDKKEENTVKAQGEKRRARYLAALLFPKLLHENDELLQNIPQKECKTSVIRHASLNIIQDNLPDLLRRLLILAAENDAMFLDDIAEDILKKSISQLKEEDLDALIFLFNKYKYSPYPIFKKDYSGWQARLVLLNVLQILAAPPYQNEKAIHVIKHYYEKLIEIHIPDKPSHGHDIVAHRLSLHENLYHQSILCGAKKINIDSKEIVQLSQKIQKSVGNPLTTDYKKQQKLHEIASDLVKMNDLLQGSNVYIEKTDYLKKNLMQRLHKDSGLLLRHRAAWKYRLANALFSLTGIGALIVAGNYAYSGQLLWSKTNSQKKLEELERIIENGYHKLKLTK